MCFVKYLTVAFSVGSPVENQRGTLSKYAQKILIPPAKHDFHISVSLNAFASKAATNVVIAGHSSKELEIL